jgi:hypothetical protein
VLRRPLSPGERAILVHGEREISKWTLEANKYAHNPTEPAKTGAFCAAA